MKRLLKPIADAFLKLIISQIIDAAQEPLNCGIYNQEYPVTLHRTQRQPNDVHYPRNETPLLS